jgi:hypothetical protein
MANSEVEAVHFPGHGFRIPPFCVLPDERFAIDFADEHQSMYHVHCSLKWEQEELK